MLSIAVGKHFVTVRVSSEAEADLRRGLEEAAELLSDHHASRTETLTRMAWLIADLPIATLLRSREERLSFLSAFREGLLLSALFGVLLAIVLSYGVARTVTRPLLAITEAMSEMTSTGDLARKIELRGRWIDADATVLARAFNRLTESIARFQREAASRERLSALGRMSTVIAHEIRNPLMIIKASVRSFRRAKGMDEDVLEAADDIDHEVARIDRIVGDVLDFARPLRLDLQPNRC